MPRPERAIILAAGAGGRLLPDTADKPKGLLSVGAESIIEYQIRALRKAGIAQIALVTGHAAERVHDALGDSVLYFHNERYRETNSLYSLWIAAEFGRAGCLVFNSDVLFHPALLEKLLASSAEDAILVDYGVELGEEEMKVTAPGGIIAKISKNIDPREAEGENVGIVKMGREGAAAVFDVAAAFARAGAWNLWAPHAIEALIGRHPFAAIPTEGRPWIEIDYRHDLKRARDEVYPIIAEALDGIAQR
ncbi:MAG: Bifunctional IPC transferase and DIPP synthase [candidate division BRC1 bacterium ADurb.BinA364]|nr:MAG: Bifunctional IPC transferase and DIPP synthase [candidate division BRC1 bacterium ADurb.BinA364]